MLKKRILKYSKKIFPNNIHININPFPDSSLLLAAAGRSGSTWVANIINYNNEYRFMFEPFNPVVDLWKTYRHPIYLRTDDHDKDFLNITQKILSGNIGYYKFVDRFSKYKFIVNKKLIKCTWLNFLLGWVHKSFPRIPIILLFRHPCAIAYSRLMYPEWFWINLNNHILTNEKLVEDFLKPFKKELGKIKSPFAQNVATSCIQYYVPLKQLKKGDAHLAFYENFCTEPLPEIDRLFSFLGYRYTDSIFSVLKNPSPLASKNREKILRDNTSSINTWESGITKQEARIAFEIMEMFGLDKIYPPNRPPSIAGALEMIRK